MEPIIKVDNVSMCFNLSKEKHESLKEYFLAMVQGRLQYDEFYALKDVSLDIMPGDFYGLVGLNGSGKSTLLKTIAGVYKPSKGKVTVNGTIAPLIELGAGFDMDLTARENIYLNGTLGFQHLFGGQVACALAKAAALHKARAAPDHGGQALFLCQLHGVAGQLLGAFQPYIHIRPRRAGSPCRRRRLSGCPRSFSGDRGSAMPPWCTSARSARWSGTPE